ncbi:KxYKxGKxW signal peptide domain-containing protein [Lacticaseibacillus pabuli]|uniref:KxYKxGKxW signal peptide domain-containing protein n=1 Tax=Lacticaseibacillus pabuli TaxID=3025672 RepID=A0ABY7WSS9_9LACO|nr:KxYKxGKxW signal peptide domain-containing protein [Lacticaseibacillus sp. KACC 23028]WDF83237.1 KxYKxGKxW signal peptide domain-containing protein [Lacticaseibacillus sp. KACC 23028]
MRYEKEQDKLIRATLGEKRHYKMFKSGKQWVVAGISLLFVGTIVAMRPDSAAAATSTTPATQTEEVAKTPADESSDNTNKVALSGDAGSNASDTSNVKSDADKQDTPVVAKEDAAPDAQAAATQPTATTKDATTPNTVATADSKAATPAQDASVQPDDTASAVPAVSDDKPTVQTNSTTTETDLGDATAEQLIAAQSAAKAAYLATGKPQKVTAMQGGPVAASQATLVVNNPVIGADSGLQQATLSFTMTNPQAGDVYTITIPHNSVMAFQGTDDLSPEMTTSAAPSAGIGQPTVLTDTWHQTVNSTVTQTITLMLANGYWGQQVGMTDVGTTVVQIPWTINGQAGGVGTITTKVTPTADMKPISRLNPAVAAVNSTVPNVGGVVPDTNYVYQFDVSENTGASYNLSDGFASHQVNSGPNWGTTITIPVPTGFVLDNATTTALNAFTDATTITQSGGAGSDIVINVPKGSGSQNVGQAAAYRLAGKYTIAQTASNQTLTAAGDVTMVQKINATGDKLTFQTSPWTETLLGTNSTPTVQPTLAVFGNNVTGSSNQLVLNPDPSSAPTQVGTFTLYNQSPLDSTDTQLKMTMPDGLDVTSVGVPIGGVSPKIYMPGTTSYSYAMTLADGTTEAGTVAAGGRVTPTDSSAIRQIVFTPNFLAAGAMANANFTNSSFQLFGSLASKYDDGTPVKIGDTLVLKGETSNPMMTQSLTSSYGQNVVAATSSAQGLITMNTTASDPFAYQKPGNVGGVISMEKLSSGENTDYIYEPILYYVLPSEAFVSGVIGTQDAKVTQSVAADGRTIVKIDYTGTHESVDIATPSGQNNAVQFTNSPDALPGNYPFAAYIYSPNTPLRQVNEKVPDPTLTDGHADALVMGRNGMNNWVWPISVAGVTTGATMAQGDEVQPVKNATIGQNSTNPVSLVASVVNTNGDRQNMVQVLNLPDSNDGASQLDFHLTGPVTLPATLTSNDSTVAGEPLDAEILYATTPMTFTAGQVGRPDLSNYVTAAQVGNNWDSIRSVAIEIGDLPQNSSTGRIKLQGQIVNMTQQAGKTGYLQSGIYIDGAAVNLDVASANGDNSKLTSITVTLQFKEQVNDDEPSVTPDDYFDYTQPGIPGPGIHVWTDNTQPGGGTSTLPETNGNTTPGNGGNVPSTTGGGTTTQTTAAGKPLPDTFGGNTATSQVTNHDNTQSNHQNLPATGGTLTSSRAVQVATSATSAGNNAIVATQSSAQQGAKAALPQTGDGNSTGLVALGLAALGGLFGLAGRRRKQD